MGDQYKSPDGRVWERCADGNHRQVGGRDMTRNADSGDMHNKPGTPPVGPHKPIL
ncbi:MAG: hypothetical protein AAGC46_19280 [Solirubrobacteraceae bacterium]|nr:hypothetical protein [Patulibacter sp.]